MGGFEILSLLDDDSEMVMMVVKVRWNKTQSLREQE